MAPTADKRLTAAIAGAGLAEDAKPARSFSMAVFHFALAGLLIITIAGHAAAEGPARASVDPRTGAIVVSGGELERSNVPRGAPVVRVIEEPVVSQPPPFSSGQTVVVPRTRIEIEGGTTGGSAGRTIRIVEEPVVSHPPPFSKGGRSVVVPRTRIVIEDERERIWAPLRPGESAESLVEKLNQMGFSRDELIAALDVLKRAGIYRGEFIAR